jgi:hypothetical protein
MLQLGLENVGPVLMLLELASEGNRINSGDRWAVVSDGARSVLLLNCHEFQLVDPEHIGGSAKAEPR